MADSRKAFLSSGIHERPARVLVIDDEPFVADALRRVLGDENQVTVAASGMDALTRFEAGERFDVVFCDVMMPGMDGREFHERLSAKFAEDARRVVFITGGAWRPEIRQFLDTIPNVCLDKPLDIDGVRELVRRRVRAAGDTGAGDARS